MGHYPIPASKPKSVKITDTFRGVDYTSEPGNVSEDKSPYAPNMIRDVPGKVRKSVGWYVFDKFDGRINGRHHLVTDNFSLIHEGKNLWKYKFKEIREKIFTGMADNRSRSWQLNGKLVIQDGKQLLIWDGVKLTSASEGAYIPTLTIGKAPNGGGKSYEAFNLIQPYYTETFLSDGKATDYQLSLAPLDAGSEVKAYLKNAEGVWEPNTAFTVDYDTGTVKFTVPPGEPPVTGEDNVKITAKHTVEGYADRVLNCTIGTLFGVGGIPDRLFVSGNPDVTLQHYDWYSGQNDPTYWPDIGYSTLGSSKAAVVGYAQVQNFLAAFKDERDPERSVVLRRGELVEKEPAFPVYNTLQGPGAIAPHSFAYLGNEPLFLTAMGVYAITTSDVTGDKYEQNRSYYIDGALRKQPDLQEAVAFTHDNMYFLCLNGQAFILDGLQSLADRNMPYSTRQYACFNRLNMPARVLWEAFYSLCFGTDDGRLCAFYNDLHSSFSYSDGAYLDGSVPGVPIEAAWETPDLTGNKFYRNKNFRYLAIRQQGAVYSGVKMFAMKQGIWKLLKEEEYASRYLYFPEIVFSKFTFSCDTTNKTLHTKTKLKKLDEVRFRFENDKLNEPFGLMSWAVEFVESGNFKG